MCNLTLELSSKINKYIHNKEKKNYLIHAHCFYSKQDYQLIKCINHVQCKRITFFSLNEQLEIRCIIKKKHLSNSELELFKAHFGASYIHCENVLRIRNT